MPAHVPRRSFAKPFIVTVAATTVACASAPQAHEPTPTNPPPTQEPGPMRASSAEIPRDRNWTLTRDEKAGTCAVAEAGATPAPYPCPAGVLVYPAHIILDKGETQCKAVWEPAPMQCPPTATCNPPPTQVSLVPCPK